MAELSQDSFDIVHRPGGGDDAPVLRAGSVIAGRYRVDHTIGQGGMGLVLGATHLETGERVAIKVLHAAALQNKEAVARFEREARAAGKMNGAYTARILDVGTLESNAPYIVMEYLHGEDLARILKSRGPLPIAEAVDYVTEACEALAGAHGAGIVHRDLKPGNLFLARVAGERAGEAPTQHIKILDFGISKIGDRDHDEAESTLTTTESFLGSPVYMSPEQMAAPKKVDTRSDIWALGVTLYRLLTRQVPFSGDSPMAMCSVILAGVRPRPVRHIRDDVPEALNQAILGCLAREPADRIQDVAALAEAIAPFGTRSAAASARRARELLGTAGVPRGNEGPVLPPVEASRDPDAVETLMDPGAAGTLSTWAGSRARTRVTSRRVLAVASAAGLSLAAAIVFYATHPAPVGVPPLAAGSAAATAPSERATPVMGRDFRAPDPGCLHGGQPRAFSPGGALGLDRGGRPPGKHAGDDGAPSGRSRTLPQTPGDDGAPPGRSRTLPQTPGDDGAPSGRSRTLPQTPAALGQRPGSAAPKAAPAPSATSLPGGVFGGTPF